MQNARLVDLQVGIKIARRDINNLRYADDTTLMAESEEELSAGGCDGAQARRRGTTPRLRSGAEAESARLRQRRSSREDLCPWSGVPAERSYWADKVRGGGREEQPHVQGAVAAWSQEGIEELLHIQGHEGQQ